MVPIPNTSIDERESRKPEILEKQDRPFPANDSRTAGTVVSAQSVPELIKLNDQKPSHEVDNFKNTTGKHILYGCLAAMAVAAVADSIWHVDSPLLTSAFEVCKIVATTILGYFFGSKAK